MNKYCPEAVQKSNPNTKIGSEQDTMPPLRSFLHLNGVLCSFGSCVMKQTQKSHARYKRPEIMTTKAMEQLPCEE